MTHYTFNTSHGRWAASGETESEALERVMASGVREPRPKFTEGDRVYVVNRAGEVVIRDTVIAWTEWADDVTPSYEIDLATGDSAWFANEWFYGVRDPHDDFASADAPSYSERLIRPYADPAEHETKRKTSRPAETA